jgi:F-type H+-transporting ATPase subunit epsilon
MFLEIITPDRHVFDGEVTSATFPGSSGSFQVLHNHAPIISALDKGKVAYRTDDGEHTLTVEGGVVEVLNNKITVLVEKVLEEE